MDDSSTSQQKKVSSKQDLEKIQADFLKELVLSKRKSQQQPLQEGKRPPIELPYNLICFIAEMLEHDFVLNKLCLAAKHYYIAMQFRYRSLCIQQGFISGPESQDPLQEAQQIEQNIRSIEQLKENTDIASIVQKTLEEKILDSKNYMSIYGKFMSKCQMIVDLKQLSLDPLCPDQVKMATKQRRNSQHQIANDEKLFYSGNPQNVYRTFREDSPIRNILESNFKIYNNIVVLKDGRHFICSHNKSQAELMELNNQQVEELIQNTSQMIAIPHCFIDQIATQQNQFIFTTRQPGQASQLYHGVLEEVQDPSQTVQLQIKSIFGPIQVEKLEERDKDGNNLEYEMDFKLISISQQASCMAVVRKVFAENLDTRQLEFLYTWSLEKIVVQQSQDNDQLITKPITEEITVITQEKDSIQQFPTFKDIKATTQFALLAESNDVYLVGVSQQKKGSLEARIVSKLNNIVQLEAKGHFLALQVIKKQPIVEWTHEQVAAFLDENGFDEYSKLAISHKINGAQIAEFDEDFWMETFGIEQPTDLLKLRFEVAQSQRGRIVKQDVLAWGGGRNNWGQLGLASGETASHPRSIPLPEEITSINDEILQIQCGKRHSVMLTKAGKLWVTGNFKELKTQQVQKFEEEKQSNQQQDNTLDEPHKKGKQRAGKGQKKANKQFLEMEDEAQFDDSHSQGKQKKGGKGQKKGKKFEQEEIQKQIIDVPEIREVSHRWFNLLEKRGEQQTIISHKFMIENIKMVDQMHLLALDVSRKFIPIGSKYFVAVEDYDADTIGSINDSANKKNKWGTKFKDVDRAMAFLCYDRKIFNNPDGSQKDYTVVYEDRFVGNVETEVWRFHEEMDIPSHRVRMLKLNGQVIWDRTKKFSLI